MNYRIRVFIIFFFLLTGFSLSASTILYVQSPAAKLLNSPEKNSSGKPIPRGTSVQVAGEKDMYIKVKSSFGDGYIMKLFLSKMPPGGKVQFGSEIDKSTSVKARSRASSYTETAAARGYSESAILRTRGSQSDYDFDAIQWLEKVSKMGMDGKK